MVEFNSEVSELDVKRFIDKCDISLLTFRYFDKRPFSIIKGHIYTVLMKAFGEDVGYGHLEKENDKIWLGIIIMDKLKSKGYGSQLIDNLIENYIQLKPKENLCLTVDIANTAAQSLFIKKGFSIESKINSRSYLMRYELC